MYFFFLEFSLIFRIASGYVVCPYCDPNHVAYPNLEETCRGYDVPMGNPNPGKKKQLVIVKHGLWDPFSICMSSFFTIYWTGNSIELSVASIKA
jgi:hypothetical protein